MINPNPDGSAKRPKVRGKKLLATTTGIIIILIISPVLLATIWFLGKNTQKDIEETVVKQFGEQELVIAGEIAQIFETEIANTEEKLNMIAQIPEVKKGDSETCSRKLEEVLEEMHVKLGNLGRVNKDGIFYCGVVRSIIGVDGKKYDYLRQIINDLEHKPVLSRAIMFQYADQTRYLTALHVPVFDEDGSFIGTLGGAIYFDELQEKYLKTIAFPRGGYAFLLDDNGDILSHPNPDFISRNVNDEYMEKVLAESQELQDLIKEVQAGKTGTKKYLYQGEWKLAAYKPARMHPHLKGRYWGVAVTTSLTQVESLISSLISRLKYQVFVVIGILILFTLGMIVLLIRWNQALAQQVRERTKQLKESQKKELAKAKRIAELKDEFVFVATHELKAPVTAISGFLGFAQEEAKSRGVKEALNNLDKANQRLLKLVHDLLEVARAEAGRIEIETFPIDITTPTLDVIENLKPLADKKKLEIIYAKKKLPKVLADQERVSQIITNLLSNAIKYSPEKGKITIGHEVQDKQLVTLVQDTGAGIPKKDFPKVFAKFYRSDQDLVRAQEGTGLGLFIAKQIVEKMNGKIWFESAEGKGSTFFFSLPPA